MTRKKLINLLFVLICIGSCISSAQCLEFKVSPYLQNPSKSGITVMWVTSEASSGEIQIGKAPDKLGKIVPASNVQPDICKAKINNLKPGTKYYYRVQAKTAEGKSLTSDVSSFVTLNPRADTTRAVFFNDIHSILNTYTKLATQCSNFDYSLAFFNGDCWSDPTKREDVLKNMATYVNGLHPSIPLLFAHGNHEWRGPLSNQMWTLFDTPNLNGQDEWGKQKWYYSLTQGPVHFIVLDCGEDQKKNMEVFQPYRMQEAEWLKQEVKSPEFRKAAFRVLVVHIPLYTEFNGIYNDDENSSIQCRLIFEPILKSAGIDMEISAHTHIAKLSDSRVGNNKEHFPYPVVIGGGPLDDSATLIELNASRNTLQAKILDINGKLVDSISIQKPVSGR